MPVFQLTDELVFPPPELAEPEGLLAVGGDLCVERLLLAYRMGIFPWYSEAEPILWWSPDPRMILDLHSIKVSRSLQRELRRPHWTVTADTSFARVIRRCAEIRRPRETGTWLVDAMIAAYCRLHARGYAHSIEAWHEGELAGGLYGVSLGRMFFGESMFSDRRDASKVALVHLARTLPGWGIECIDCQVPSDHLRSLGAREIPRSMFLRHLRAALRAPTLRGSWSGCWPGTCTATTPGPENGSRQQVRETVPER